MKDLLYMMNKNIIIWRYGQANSIHQRWLHNTTLYSALVEIIRHEGYNTKLDIYDL